MHWMLVPLQYLFLRWKAEKELQKAKTEKNPGAHARAVRRSMAATVRVELMQMRFPDVTDRIDTIRNRDVVQESYKA
jgi:hypothetical protein